MIDDDRVSLCDSNILVAWIRHRSVCFELQCLTITWDLLHDVLLALLRICFHDFIYPRTPAIILIQMLKQGSSGYRPHHLEHTYGQESVVNRGFIGFEPLIMVHHRG